MPKRSSDAPNHNANPNKRSSCIACYQIQPASKICPFMEFGNFISPLVMEFLDVKSMCSFGATNKYHQQYILPSEIKRRKNAIKEYEYIVTKVLSKRKVEPLSREDFSEAKKLCQKARMLIGPPRNRSKLYKQDSFSTRKKMNEDRDWLFDVIASGNNEISSRNRQFCYCCQKENNKNDPFFEERIKMVPKQCDSPSHDPTLYMLPDCFYISPKEEPMTSWIPTDITLALLKNMALTIWSAEELMDNSCNRVLSEDTFSNGRFLPHRKPNARETFRFRHFTRYQALPFSQSQMALHFFRIAATDIAKSHIRAQSCLRDVIDCADILHCRKNDPFFVAGSSNMFFNLDNIDSAVMNHIHEHDSDAHSIISR